MDKIAKSLEGDISIEPDWLSEHVGVLPEDRVRIDPEVWAQVAGHIERREAMRADYQTFAGRVSRYGLHPLHLLAYHGNWYVLARNAEKSQIETFALSRFRGIEAAGSTFPAPPTSTPSATPGKPSGSPAVRNRSRCGCSSNRNWWSMSPSRDGTRARSSSTGPMAGSRCGWRQPGRRNSSAGCHPGVPGPQVLAAKTLRDRIAKLQEG